MAIVSGGSMNRISQQRARAREWRMLLQPDEAAPEQSGHTEPAKMPKNGTGQPLRRPGAAVS